MKSGIFIYFFLVVIQFGAGAGLLSAEEIVADERADHISEGPDQDQIVIYPATFFDRYTPNSAFEMVQQIPGFKIDNGDLTRGFGNTTGNILINDKYPSAKQDRPSATLERIPASQVERIELIRGQVRGINLQGKSVVANIILRDYEQATIRWDGYYKINNHGPAKPNARIFLSNRWQKIEYLAGLKVEREASGEHGPEKVVSADNILTEIRNEKRRMTGRRITANMNATTWVGETLAKLNANYEHKTNNAFFTSSRLPQLPAGRARDDIVDEEKTTVYYEIGFDAERSLLPDLLGKAIVLYFRQNMPIYTTRQVIDAAGNLGSFRIADTEIVTTESIARLEFDWSGLPDHFVRLNFEGTLNALDSRLIQTEDIGAGPSLIDVPGSNTRVEEVRGDFQVKDIWTFGKFELDYGIGAELSAITQTGDADLKRTFHFIKPHTILTYSPSKLQLMRFRIAREVSQLDFNDFVSATVYEDNDLALGNPDLQPEKTWLAEYNHEWRFDRDRVISIKLFHHWISDVEDLLPLTARFEVPGNIGTGRRWGIEFESTMPLHGPLLDGAKLTIKARWQDSAVTDPVTGNKRVLSAVGDFAGEPSFKFNSENKYTFNLAYRQDFQDAQVAWGWDVSTHAKRPLFRVNQLDVYHEGILLNTFIETTRWYGIKIGLEGGNLFDYFETRDRTFYTGSRDLTPVDYKLLRSRTPGRRLSLYVSGSF